MTIDLESMIQEGKISLADTGSRGNAVRGLISGLAEAIDALPESQFTYSKTRFASVVPNLLASFSDQALATDAMHAAVAYAVNPVEHPENYNS